MKSKLLLLSLLCLIVVGADKCATEREIRVSTVWEYNEVQEKYIDGFEIHIGEKSRGKEDDPDKFHYDDIYELPDPDAREYKFKHNIWASSDTILYSSAIAYYDVKDNQDRFLRRYRSKYSNEVSTEKPGVVKITPF